MTPSILGAFVLVALYPRAGLSLVARESLPHDYDLESHWQGPRHPERDVVDLRIPLHLHVHKSGGTQFSHIAFKQYEGLGKRVEQVMLGGLTMFRRTGGNMAGDGPGSVDKDPVSGTFANRGWSCVDRYEHALRHQRAYMGREIFADAKNCSKYFIYTTGVRDPVSRMLSNFAFHRHNVADLQRWTDSTVFSECYGPNDNRHMLHQPIQPGKTQGRLRCSLAPWVFSHGTAPYDNFNVRMFAGEDTFLKPLGGVDRADLDRAKRFLDLHEVVIILEKLPGQFVQAEVALNWTLPWNYGEDQRKTPRRGDRHLPGILIDKLRRQNALDMEFYEYAIQRAEQLTARAVELKKERRRVSPGKSRIS